MNNLKQKMYDILKYNILPHLPGLGESGDESPRKAFNWRKIVVTYTPNAKYKQKAQVSIHRKDTGNITRGSSIKSDEELTSLYLAVQEYQLRSIDISDDYYRYQIQAQDAGDGVYYELTFIQHTEINAIAVRSKIRDLMDNCIRPRLKGKDGRGPQPNGIEWNGSGWSSITMTTTSTNTDLYFTIDKNIERFVYPDPPTELTELLTYLDHYNTGGRRLQGSVFDDHLRYWYEHVRNGANSYYLSAMINFR